MIKNLVSFGCSWTHGEELKDPTLDKDIMHYDIENDSYRLSHSYPGLIANHYGWSHEDLSSNGASLQSMLWNFNYWLDNNSTEHINNSFVLIGLTSESRYSWYNINYKESLREGHNDCHRYVHSSWIDNKHLIKGEEERMDSWRVLNNLYNELSFCEDWFDTNYNTVVRAFDGIAVRNNINMIQFNVLSMSHKLKVPTLLDSSSALEMLVIRNKPRKDPLFTNGKHPNEKGHKILADFLIEKIDKIL